MTGKNKLPLIGWHSQDPTLKHWLENEASVRGVTLREYLDEVLAAHRANRETAASEKAAEGAQ